MKNQKLALFVGILSVCAVVFLKNVVHVDPIKVVGGLAQATVENIEKFQPILVGKTIGDSKKAAVKIEPDFSKTVPSAAELQGIYENKSIVEIKSMIEELNNEVAAKSLIQKFNDHSITEVQMQELALIARKRVVLTSVLVTKEMAEYKAKQHS